MNEIIKQLTIGQEFIAYGLPMKLTGSSINKEHDSEFVTLIHFENTESKQKYAYTKKEFALFIKSKEVNL